MTTRNIVTESMSTATRIRRQARETIGKLQERVDELEEELTSLRHHVDALVEEQVDYATAAMVDAIQDNCHDCKLNKPIACILCVFYMWRAL